MLMCKNEIELRAILTDNSQVRDEEVRRLIRAMNCLRICQTCLKSGRKEQNDLFWDSWDRHHHSQLKPGTSPRTERGKLNNKGIRHHHNHNPFTINNGTPMSNQHEQQTQSPLELSPPEHVPQSTSEELSFHNLTPSPSPPNSPANNSKTRTKGFPTTPPPKKKHQTLVSATSVLGTPPPHSNNTGASNAIASNVNSGYVGTYDQQSLSKSRSHEFQLIKQQQQKQQEQNNQEQQQQLSQSQDNSHPLLTSSNSHQPSSTNQTSNGNSTTPDSGVHMHSSTTTINTSECNTNISYSIPTPRSRLHTEPGE